MIHVTKTYLPKRESLDQYIDQIYQSNWVTNNGSLVKLLEKRLAEYLGVKNIVLVSNDVNRTVTSIDTNFVKFYGII